MTSFLQGRQGYSDASYPGSGWRQAILRTNGSVKTLRYSPYDVNPWVGSPSEFIVLCGRGCFTDTRRKSQHALLTTCCDVRAGARRSPACEEILLAGIIHDQTTTLCRPKGKAGETKAPSVQPQRLPWCLAGRWQSFSPVAAPPAVCRWHQGTGPSPSTRRAYPEATGRM
jgi:hypothetical protein